MSRVKNHVIFTYGFCFSMDFNNVSFFVESCQLLFKNKLSWIFYQLIYFHDNKKNYFFDNLCIIIELITVFIFDEYKAIIKQLIITSHHFLIVRFSKKQIAIELSGICARRRRSKIVIPRASLYKKSIFPTIFECAPSLYT